MKCSTHPDVLRAFIPASSTVMKAVEPLGGGAWLAEVGSRRWAFDGHSLTLGLAVLCFLLCRDENSVHLMLLLQRMNAFLTRVDCDFLKPWARINLSSPKLFLSGIGQWCKSGGHNCSLQLFIALNSFILCSWLFGLEFYLVWKWNCCFISHVLSFTFGHLDSDSLQSQNPNKMTLFL